MHDVYSGVRPPKSLIVVESECLNYPAVGYQPRTTHDISKEFSLGFGIWKIRRTAKIKALDRLGRSEHILMRNLKGPRCERGIQLNLTVHSITEAGTSMESLENCILEEDLIDGETLRQNRRSMMKLNS